MRISADLTSPYNHPAAYRVTVYVGKEPMHSVVEACEETNRIWVRVPGTAMVEERQPCERVHLEFVDAFDRPMTREQAVERYRL
jgi:hypothetical protein